MSSALLTFASLALLGVIAAQDYLYAPFRQETISQGFNGPNHLWLDGSMLLLAIALCVGASGRWPLEAFAIVTSIGLIGIAVTNTAWRWVDGLTGELGGHERWHLAFTAIVFLGAFAFEAAGNRGALWWLTAVNIAAPIVVWLLSRRQDYAEKVGVLILCIWLIAWAT
ncbi:MAG: hypothetical protein ACREUG_14860 [Steroidobacteraceae bacterium]